MRRSIWLALAVALHLTLLTLALQRRLDPLFNDAAHRIGPATDFRAYVSAARHHARGESMYGQGPGFGYRYHPLLIVLIGPALTALPRDAAFGLWVLLDEIALLALCILIARIIDDERARFGFTVGALCCAPYLLEAYMGNATFISCVLAGFAFNAERRNRSGSFVALWVASVIVKPIAVVFVPWFLFRRSYRAVLGFTAATAGSALVFFNAHPIDWAGFRAVNLGHTSAPGWLVHAGQHGLHGWFASLLTRISGHSTATLGSFDELPLWARVVLAAIPLVVGALALAAMIRLRHADSGVGFFLCIAAYLLGYKDVWEHSYTAMMVALPWLYRSRVVPTRILAVCAIVLALPTPFALYDVALPIGPNDPEHHWTLAVSLFHHAWRPVWLMALFVAVAIHAFERDVATRSPA